MTRSLIALGVSLSVFGQEQPKDSIAALDEVVLFGLKTPQKEALIGKNVRVLKAEELKAYNSYSVAQLINTVSGITVQGAQLSRGNTQSIYARGGRSKQVLILIDGVRVVDPYSASLSYDLRLLNVSDIQQIEVLKGASSAVYGTAAATAVIAITTKEHLNGALQLRSGLGTNATAEDQNTALNYRSLGLNYASNLSSIDYQLNYSYLLEGGVSALENTSEEDPFKQRQFSLSLKNKVSNRLHWNFRSSFTSMSSDYDDSFNAADEPFQFLTDKLLVSIQSHYKLEKGSLFLGLNHIKYSSENKSTYPGEFESATTNMDFYYKGWILNKIESLVGIQSSIDASSSINEASVTTIDPYVSFFIKSDSGFNVNTGMRFNHHQTYGNHFVGHLNPSYVFGKENQYAIYSSIASAFISPSLFQLYGDWGANENLSPEKNTTYEAGIRGTHKNSSWNVLLFKRDEQNAVYWNQELFQYDNALGTTKAKGMELDFSTKLTNQLLLKMNYTAITRDRELMIRIPKTKINLAATYTKGKHSLLFETQYVGNRYDTDFSSYANVDLDPYTLLNFNWNYQLNKNTDLQVAVHNLLNNDFVEQIGYQSLGRTLRLNLRFRLL